MNGGVIANRVPLSTTFELLSAPRRRYALYALHWAGDDAVAFEDLVAAVGHLRESLDDATTDPDELAAVLWHSHLPALSEAGVIDVDPRSDTVRYYESPSLSEWLEHAAYTELPSSHPFLQEDSWPVEWDRTISRG